MRGCSFARLAQNRPRMCELEAHFVLESSIKSGYFVRNNPLVRGRSRFQLPPAAPFSSGLDDKTGVAPWAKRPDGHPLKRQAARSSPATAPPCPSPLEETLDNFDFYTLARFWSKVRVDKPERCWLWRGGKSDHGYGRFKIKGKLQLPHRVAFEMKNGPIAQGEGYHGTVILHMCDNPSCCNPAHLSAGTQQDNVVDMVVKGRGNYGRRHSNEALAKAVSDPRPIRIVAAETGISRTRIQQLRLEAKKARATTHPQEGA